MLTGVSLLGGSWVVISGVISKVTIVISLIRGLIALLITTHEPPSNLNTVFMSGVPRFIDAVKMLSSAALTCWADSHFP